MDFLEKRKTLLEQCPLGPSNATDNSESGPIHVTQWGDTGPTVLLIHGGVQGGLGGGPTNFVKQKPLADRGWILRLPDRPGFGRTPSRGPDDQLGDAAWIAEELGKGSHLIGHSFGGAEALLAAALRPETVRSLILIEPALQPMLTTDPKLLAQPDIQAALQVVGKPLLIAQTPGEFAKSFAAGLGSGSDGGLNPSAALLSEHPELATALGCAILRARIASPADMRKAADTIAAAGIPVACISGGYSPGQDAAGHAFAKFTRGEHVVIPSPNHFIQQASYEEFNKFLEGFLGKVEKSGR
jgi:pimeloyl-ACP methyl ester carboxylesterase